MTIQPVSAIETLSATLSQPSVEVSRAGGEPSSFGQMLLDGIRNTNEAQATADRAVSAFALDDNVPLHQVTFALEQARLSLELLVQVRNRMVETYQQIMNMQL